MPSDSQWPQSSGLHKSATTYLKETLRSTMYQRHRWRSKCNSWVSWAMIPKHRLGSLRHQHGPLNATAVPRKLAKRLRIISSRTGCFPTKSPKPNSSRLDSLEWRAFIFQWPRMIASNMPVVCWRCCFWLTVRRTTPSPSSLFSRLCYEDHGDRHCWPRSTLPRSTGNDVAR